MATSSASVLYSLSKIVTVGATLNAFRECFRDGVRGNVVLAPPDLNNRKPVSVVH